MFIRSILAALSAAAAAGLAVAQDDVSPDVSEALESAEPALSDGLTPAEPELYWGETSEVQDVVCRFRGDIDYEPGEVSCHFILVPENRERPDSRMIRLHFVKIAAKNEEERREDPVVYLTGGPGAEASYYVGRFIDHGLVETRDLFVLEQRGIGDSGDFCEKYDAVDRRFLSTLTVEEGEAEAARRMGACFEQAAARGVDLTAYNTVENARDVKALREALGFESWNVWGISYGSHLGQMYAQTDPDGIEALVIDAIVPNDLGDLMRIHRWANRVLENVFSTCDEVSHCDGLEDRLFAEIDRLREDRLVVDVDEAELFPAGQLSIGAEMLAFPAFMMMYEQDEHPAIPAVLDAMTDLAESRDEEIFAALAEQLGGLSEGYANGMSSAIRCNDGYVHASADVVAEDMAENPRLAGIIATPEGARLMAETCEAHGLVPRDRADYQLVQSDLPTLIVNGAWDPVTPPPLAERIAPGFSNGRLIMVPYAGHGPTRSMGECAGEVMTAFFDDPSADLDASCLEEGVPAPEYAEYMLTLAPLKAIAMGGDDPKKLAPSGLWAGGSLIVLLGFALLTPLGFFARVIDGRPAEDLAANAGLASFAGFLTSLAGLGGMGLIGYGAYQASEISETSLLAGFAPPAAGGGYLLMAAGLFGLATLLALFARLRGGTLRIGSLLGLLLTGAAGLSLSAFAFVWGLLPL